MQVYTNKMQEKDYVLKTIERIRHLIVNGWPLTLGGDVGFGVSKFVAYGFEPVIMPTIYGHARSLQYDEKGTFEKYPGDRIALNEIDYFIGNLALSQLTAAEQFRMRGREDVNHVRLMMILAGLGKMLKGIYSVNPIRVRFATGLPVDHLDRDKDGFRAILTSMRHVVKTDQAEFPVEFEQVWIMPQPHGALNYYSLLPDGDENKKYVVSRAAVFDLGTFTFDISTEKEGEAIDSQSGTRELGVHFAYNAIARRYEADFGEKPDNRRIEEILRVSLKDEDPENEHANHFKVSGEWVTKWIPFVKGLVEPIQTGALALASETVGKATDHDVIYCVGGPISLISKAVKKVYKQAVTPETNSQTINAEGFLKFAHSTLLD